MTGTPRARIRGARTGMWRAHGALDDVAHGAFAVARRVDDCDPSPARTAGAQHRERLAPQLACTPGVEILASDHAP